LHRLYEYRNDRALPTKTRATRAAPVTAEPSAMAALKTAILPAKLATGGIPAMEKPRWRRPRR
jgi:hypothetical protein